MDEVKLRQAELKDIDDLCQFLSVQMARGLRPEEYRAIFTYPWRPADAPLGFLLEAQGKIVGFMGCIWADRKVKGSNLRYCNLSNWCVLPEYRRWSLDLFFAIVKAEHVTYTDLSAIPEIVRLLTALKFKLVSKNKLFTAPFLHVASLIHRATVKTNSQIVSSDLDEEQGTYWQDHQNLGCQFTLIVDGDDRCYLISIKRKRKGFHFSEILFCSNPKLLLKHLERVKLSIFRRDLTLALAIDEHMLGAPVRGFVAYNRPKFFRSPDVEASQIDHLYSETALL